MLLLLLVTLIATGQLPDFNVKTSSTLPLILIGNKLHMRKVKSVLLNMTRFLRVK